MMRFNLDAVTFEPPHGKTNNLHRRKQRRQFLFDLNPKFQASSSFLCLYRPVCVRPVREPHCWFFHEVANLKGFDMCDAFNRHCG